MKFKEYELKFCTERTPEQINDALVKLDLARMQIAKLRLLKEKEGGLSQRETYLLGMAEFDEACLVRFLK